MSPGSTHDRSLRLSHHKALACPSSGTAAALFPADAEWREGLDHAGRDRSAVRGHLVDFGKGDQRTPEYLSLNPYGKIPAIIDPAGPGGKPLPLFESGAILLYLAEKTGKLMPADPAARYETLEWLFFQMAAMGPMFGQVGYFHKFAGREIEDKRPLHRYRDEAKRILAIIEARLAERTWIMGDEYTIADISMLGWVRNLIGFYDAGEWSTSTR